MKNLIKNASQILLISLLFLGFLEIFCLALHLPRGASDFNEGILLRENLSTQKPKNEFRIFVYGESTMHGSGYWPSSNPVKWLEKYLVDFLPDQKIRVVNFARMGQGNFKVLKAFEETLAYKPDLAIFYTGHNLFLPDNPEDQILKKQAKSSERIKVILRKSRLLSWIQRQALKMKIKSKKNLPPQESIEYQDIEQDPSPPPTDYPYHRFSPLYQKNIAFFRNTTLNILSLAKQHHIEALFLKPVSNLKDFAPNGSNHLLPLSPEGLINWQIAYNDGLKELKQKNIPAALVAFKKAYVIDPTYADLDFELAKIYFNQGLLDKAKKSFEEARDNDTLICRATTDLLQTLEDLKASHGLNLLDTEKVLVSKVAGGILGEPMIEDNVHFSVLGHALVGKATAEEMAAHNWIAPQSEWRFEKERSFEELKGELKITSEVFFKAYSNHFFYFNRRLEPRLRYAKKAFETHPENSKAIRQLAWVYWLLKEKSKSIALYRKLRDLYPEDFKTVLANRSDVKAAFDASMKATVPALPHPR